MSAIPLSYNYRNLFVRKVTTSLTVIGIGLVVAIFLCVMALADGLATVFRASGDTHNLLILRKNASVELQSIITREQATVMTSMSGIDRDTDGKPMASAELIVVVNLDKKAGGSANVIMRGVSDKAMALRPDMKLVAGRMFTPGLSEVIVSKRVAQRFKGCGIGETMSFGSMKWNVVGLFDAQGTSPDSEIWGDVEGLLNDFKRNTYQSIVARATDRSTRDNLIAAIAGDPQLKLDGKTERAYYEEQTATAEPIKFLGICIGLIMAIGACFGAMNTMYAAVAARTKEIATLRVLGFSRFAILQSFVLESTMLGLCGGIIGCALGALAVKIALSGVTGTMNFATFSEVVFAFHLTPQLLLMSLAFAIGMGFLGGLLPAFRASFTKLTVALRQVG